MLSKGGASQDVTVAVNQVRLVAEEDAKRARDLDAPDDVAAAQHDLELVMNFRAEGVKNIGDLLTKALSNQPTAVAAIRGIAGQMQMFLASDVVYSQRVAPLIVDALDDNDLHDQAVSPSKFLPNIGWLDAAKVGNKINPDAGAASSSVDRRGQAGHARPRHHRRQGRRRRAEPDGLGHQPRPGQGAARGRGDLRQPGRERRVQRHDLGQGHRRPEDDLGRPSASTRPRPARKPRCRSS